MPLMRYVLFLQRKQVSTLVFVIHILLQLYSLVFIPHLLFIIIVNRLIVLLITITH